MPVQETVGIQDNVGTQDTVGTHWSTGNVGTAALTPSLAPWLAKRHTIGFVLHEPTCVGGQTIGSVGTGYGPQLGCIVGIH